MSSSFCGACGCDGGYVARTDRPTCSRCLRGIAEHCASCLQANAIDSAISELLAQVKPSRDELLALLVLALRRGSRPETVITLARALVGVFVEPAPFAIDPEQLPLEHKQVAALLLALIAREETRR